MGNSAQQQTPIATWIMASESSRRFRGRGRAYATCRPPDPDAGHTEAPFGISYADLPSYATF